MTPARQAELRAEFAAMVRDTDAKLCEVLAQNPVRGGVLGKIRKRIREEVE